MLLLQESSAAFRDLLAQSQDVLVVTREHPTDDSIGSLLAMGLVLERLGKEVTLVTYGPITSTLSFVSGHNQILPTVERRNQFVISLDTSAANVADVSYDFTNDGKYLRICVTPEEEMGYSEEHVRCSMRAGTHDLVIVLDTPDFESLGPAYESSRELFVSVPVVNIDAHRSNALYGEVNVVDVGATSTAEVLVPLLESLGEELIDSNVATALLAGIVAGTRSFQREVTSSRAFTIAAQLVAKGADQQRVVRSLFKNRSLVGMKLWGRVFARVEYDETSRIAWTAATRSDLEHSGASPADLEGMDEELAMSLPNVGRTVLFVEDEDGQICARITCFEGDPLAVSRAFGAPVYGARVDVQQSQATLQEIQEAVLNTLRTVPYETIDTVGVV